MQKRRPQWNHITLDLLSAVDLLLRCPAHTHPDVPDTWIFEQGSDVHLRLTEAAEQAKIALGILNPDPCDPEPVGALVHPGRTI